MELLDFSDQKKLVILNSAISGIIIGNYDNNYHSAWNKRVVYIKNRVYYLSDHRYS